VKVFLDVLSSGIAELEVIGRKMFITIMLRISAREALIAEIYGVSRGFGGII